jgi:subtilisin family serine protease
MPGVRKFFTRATALVVLLLAMAHGAASARAEASDPGHVPAIMPLFGADGPAVRTGEFLVRLSESEANTLPEMIPRHVGFGWYVVTAIPGPGALPIDAAAGLRDRLRREVSPNLVWSTLDPTSEPLFPNQWPLENRGGSGGHLGADVSARRAWGITHGDAAVLIGVIDTGVQLDHPDLAGQLVPGWDFAEGDSSPNDRDGHGSGVAGVIGAAANGQGLVGVAPGVRMMPLKVCDLTLGLGCTDSAVIEALAFAADRGVRIVNISLGRRATAYDQPLRDAIAEAERRGVLVVAAAGNDGSDNDAAPMVPASFTNDNVVAVAASDRQNLLAGFSNRGKTSVDVAAPGTDIQTLWRGTGYASATVQGTSFAAPYVAGIVGLMHSVHPCLSPSDARRILVETVKPSAPMAGATVSGGVVDASAAVRSARDRFAATSAAPRFGSPPLDTSLGVRSPCSAIEATWTLTDGRTVRSTATSIAYSLEGVFRERVTVTKGTTAVTTWVDVIAGPGFVDDDGSPFETDIAWLAATGVTRGCATDRFCPGDPVTRAQMASFLARFLGLPPADRDYFVDDATSVHQDNINRLAASGITLGCGLDRFCPSQLVTREQMASFLTRGLALAPTGLPVFSDVSGTHAFNVNALALEGITRGCGDTRFCPSSSVTRGQMAAFLSRARDLRP